MLGGDSTTGTDMKTSVFSSPDGDILRAPTSRGIALLPLLMLPMVIGALWLAVAPHRATPRTLVVLGAIALAWYLLGGLIAARRLAQEMTLRRDLARAQATLASTSDCGWIVDPEGMVRSQSVAAAQQMDLTGRGISALVAPVHADPSGAAARLLARAANGRGAQLALGDGQRIEARRLPGSTLQLWRLVIPAEPEPAPPPSAALSDFHHLPVALLDLEPGGTIAAANAAAEALLGPVAPGALLSDLLGSPGRPLTDWIAEVREGRDTGRGEVLHTRADGIERDLQVTLASAPGSGRVIAVLTDASALKTLEAQFVQSQKMQAIGQLAGGIAHDFNNLLTAITGHCDLLMLRRDKTDPDYDDLHQISQNANRAAALVRQLLAFSRKQTLKPQILDLRDALSDLTHLLNRLVGERIVLTFTNDPSLRPIRADRRQLEQVLMNLVVNARDAMPEGGEVAIRTDNIRLGAEKTLHRARLPKGDYVRVTVTDQGYGIAPETLDKIFDPFFTTKRTGEGTGLGLSTAYGIVKQTGGYIFCDSTVGHGTTFSLYFPAQRANSQKPVADPTTVMGPMTSDAPADRTHRILLVEDESPVRAFASRALKLRGFEVIEADSGERALEILRDDRQDFDMFVTDVVMPGLDGPSWVRKALEDHPETRVVFMSGYTEVTLSDSSAPIPHALFLPKPFSLSELIATVENNLAGLPGPAARAGSGQMTV